MRRYHRWFAAVAAIFILWIAGTGVITQGLRIYSGGEGAPPPAGARPPEAAAPAAREAAAQRPPQSPLRAFIHEITELHSGEALGVPGEIISFVTGLSLLFLAGSGLYMYVQMYRGRLARTEQGKSVRGGRFFW